MPDLPIYEPKFTWDRDADGRRSSKERVELRMTMLHYATGPRPRGGLAVVWGTPDELKGSGAKEVLLSRRPAVIELPDMWVTGISEHEEDYPPDEFDLLWSLTHERQAWSEDEFDVRAIGGTWLPMRRNLLLVLNERGRLRDHVRFVRERSEALCAEHGVELPSWWSKLPCVRCGGTGSIGEISMYRCPEC